MSDSHLQRGTRLGEYVLEEPLGKGGFATVWRVRHNAWPERVAAAKILHDAGEVERLRDEGTCLARLSHPNITGALGMDLDHDPPYLLLELHEGRTLREVLDEEGALSEEEAASVFEQVVKALAHSHEEGVSHGDLKPENILIAPDGQVKVTDFGLGRVRANEASLFLSGKLETKNDGIAGTIPYMAPEQREGKAPDPRSDIFTLGVLLYELVSGERPQPGDDLRVRAPGIGDLVSVFDRCYTRRDRRFADAGAIVQRMGLQDEEAGRSTGRVVPLRGSGWVFSWSLEEIEEAVAREYQIAFDRLRPRGSGSEGWRRIKEGKVLEGAKELAGEAWQSIWHSTQVQSASRLVWYLAVNHAGCDPVRLADRYRVTVAEIKKAAGRRSVRRSEKYQGAVDRLAPLPADLERDLKKGAERYGVWEGTGISLAMVACALVLLTVFLAVRGSFLAGVASLFLGVGMGVGGAAVLQRGSSERERIHDLLQTGVSGIHQRELLHAVALRSWNTPRKIAEKMLEEEDGQEESGEEPSGRPDEPERGESDPEPEEAPVSNEDAFWKQSPEPVESPEPEPEKARAADDPPEPEPEKRPTEETPERKRPPLESLMEQDDSGDEDREEEKPLLE